MTTLDEVTAGVPPPPRRPAALATIRAEAAGRSGHGLVVVGSHVGLTGRQVDVAVGRGRLVEVELAVDDGIDPGRHERAIGSTAAQTTEAQSDSDVLVRTSRGPRGGKDADDSLRSARTVTETLTSVVARSRAAGPAWVVAKGGITSHDVAVVGLAIRRATVLGQQSPGSVSVFRAEESSAA